MTAGRRPTEEPASSIIVTVASLLEGKKLYLDTPRQLDEMGPRLRGVLVGRNPGERDLDSRWFAVIR